MKALWNILVLKAATDVERTCYLKWITKHKLSAGGKTKTNIIHDSLMNAFFHNVLCDQTQMENFKTITPEIFACFERIFELINEREQNIEIARGSIKVLRFDSLVGATVPWHILLHCTNEKVLNDVKAMLVNMYLKVVSPDIDDKLVVWQNFVLKWVDCLNYSYKNKDNELLEQMISLLNLFIVKFDGVKYLHQDGPVEETLTLIVADRKGNLYMVNH